MTFRLALGEHIGVIPKTHQTNVFEARMIRLSFFVFFKMEVFGIAFLML